MHEANKKTLEVNGEETQSLRGKIDQVLEGSEEVVLSNHIKIDLANLRSYRGDNDAVVRVGKSDERLISAIQDPNNHSRDEILESIAENYSGTAYGDYQWQKTSGGWSSPEIPTIYGKFRNDYPHLAQLSLDMGVMTHLPELIELLSEPGNENLDHKIIREKLKERLGHQTMWRGMMLTEEEMEYIKKHGIMSPSARGLKSTEQPKEQFEANILSTYANELVERHFHGENLNTPFISVSAHEDVAIAVGRCFGKKSEERKLYLFKLDVPKIDCISYTEHGIKMPYKLENSPQKLSISIDGDENTYDFDKDAESYLFWKINPEEILEVKQSDTKESSWNNRKTIGPL